MISRRKKVIKIENTPSQPLDFEKSEATKEEIATATSAFYNILQGQVVNMLPTIRTKNLPADYIDHYGIATILGENYEFVINNYEALKNGIPTFVYQFLDALIIHFTQMGVKSVQIRLPLEKFMAMRGLKDIKEARQQVLNSISILQLIKFKIYESIRGKKSLFSGYISIFGGTGFIKNGIIHFNFNQDFYSILCSYSTMEIPKQSLCLNSHKNPNSYYFLKHISKNYRYNEGKERQNTIKMNTLISKSPFLPTYDDVMAADRALKRRIVQATFRDLDALVDVTYSVYLIDGTDVTEDRYQMNYNDFIASKIIVDYSSFPAHEKRVENRSKYAEAVLNQKSRSNKKCA